MAIRYDDDELRAFIEELKPLPLDYKSKLALKPDKVGNSGAELVVTGPTSGMQFRIRLRESTTNPLRFSAVLGLRQPGTSRLFLLRRYNGDHGTHTNKIEGVRIRGTHIHMATARYQDRGFKEEDYAEASTRFVDVESALACLIQDCYFVTPMPPPGDGQLLFTWQT